MGGGQGHRAEIFKAEAAKLKLSESNLREQLAMYAEKFDQFQGALTKSNAVFAKHSKDTEKVNRISCVSFDEWREQVCADGCERVGEDSALKGTTRARYSRS